MQLPLLDNGSTIAITHKKSMNNFHNLFLLPKKIGENHERNNIRRFSQSRFKQKTIK